MSPTLETQLAMSTDDPGAPSPESMLDAQRVDAIVQRLLPFSQAADAFAQRSVGKVRTLGLLGLAAAAWLAYALADLFHWGLPAFSLAFLLIALPAALLLKIQSTLKGAVGLPGRIIAVANRVAGKAAAAYDRAFASATRDAEPPRPRFRQLWALGKEVVELQALGRDAEALVGALAGAAVIGNPLFLIALACAAGSVVALTAVAGIVAVVYWL